MEAYREIPEIQVETAEQEIERERRLYEFNSRMKVDAAKHSQHERDVVMAGRIMRGFTVFVFVVSMIAMYTK